MRGDREFDWEKSTFEIHLGGTQQDMGSMRNALKSCFPLRSSLDSMSVMSYASLNFLTWLT